MTVRAGYRAEYHRPVPQRDKPREAKQTSEDIAIMQWGVDGVHNYLVERYGISILTPPARRRSPWEALD